MIDTKELREKINLRGLDVVADTDILAVLDRLEEAESDALEQARLNGMGSEREAALMAKLEAAEKSDAESLAMYRKARDERDALRAEVEAMKRQEPVRHEFQGRDGDWYPFINQRHYENTVADGTWPIRALYALPGAQAQNVPNAIAYLDIGAGGYMDIGTDLTDEALASLPKGRHMLGIVGTYGVDGYVPAQPAPEAKP